MESHEKLDLNGSQTDNKQSQEDIGQYESGLSTNRQLDTFHSPSNYRSEKPVSMLEAKQEKEQRK